MGGRGREGREGRDGGEGKGKVKGEERGGEGRDSREGKEGEGGSPPPQKFQPPHLKNLVTALRTCRDCAYLSSNYPNPLNVWW